MPAPTSRTTAKQATRERILAAARRRFEDQGFTGTSSQDVAEAAGVSHGAVFVHFGTRQVLIEAATDLVLGPAETELRTRLAGARDLRALLETHLDALAPHEAFHARLAGERAVLPGAVRERLEAFEASVASQLGGAAIALGAGALRKGVSPPFSLNAWMALVAYYLAHRERLTPRGHVLAQRRTELVEGFLCLVA